MTVVFFFRFELPGRFMNAVSDVRL